MQSKYLYKHKQNKKEKKIHEIIINKTKYINPPNEDFFFSKYYIIYNDIK